VTWVLITGADDALYRGALRAIQPEGHHVLATPSGATALQLLSDLSPIRGVVVLLRSSMGNPDATEFLGAVSASADTLRWRHAYILLNERKGERTAALDRYLAQLAIPLVETPSDPFDVDGWADLLDAIGIAERQLFTARSHS